jgi:peptidoglycan/LPS O-acetylase OafA/YrhL
MKKLNHSVIDRPRTRQDLAKSVRLENPASENSSPAPVPPVHFPGLNALRFYAAISIVIGHTTGNFGNIRAQPADIPPLTLLSLDTQSAVNLLLVLSGFLVTFLFFKEQSATGRLNIRRFYLRRILRIWPLYYLTVFIGLCLVPFLLGAYSDGSSPGIWQVILVLLLLPNFVTGVSPALEHLWCIGLQNQFYLIWPWVTRPPVGAFLRIVLGILIVKTALTPVILWMNTDSITNIFLGLRFECMAIGALGAYLYFFKSPLLRVLCGVPAKAITLIGLASLVLWDLPLTEPAILASSCVFMLLILNLCTGSSMGDMSYGIYMFHYPLLFLALHALLRLGIPEGPSYTIILHAGVISGSLLLAALSYFLFEKPFLRLKKRFAVLPTRS